MSHTAADTPLILFRVVVFFCYWDFLSPREGGSGIALIQNPRGPPPDPSVKNARRRRVDPPARGEGTTVVRQATPSRHPAPFQTSQSFGHE